MKSRPKVKLGKIIICPLFGFYLLLLAPLYTILTHYVFLINFSHNMLQLKTQWPWFDLTYQCHPRSNFIRYIKYMPYYMALHVFHTNFHRTMYRFWDISWNRSQRSKLNLSDFKMTFKLNPYLSYFRTGLVSQQRSYMMQWIWAALRYYWIISIIMGKWAKLDLSDLENDLLNNSMKFISWQLINIIPKKLCTKNKEKLSNRFWENWQKVAKQPNLTFFWTFRTLKIASKWKWAKFDLSDL